MNEACRPVSLSAFRSFSAPLVPGAPACVHVEQMAQQNPRNDTLVVDDVSLFVRLLPSGAGSLRCGTMGVDSTSAAALAYAVRALNGEVQCLGGLVKLSTR